jgi:glutathione synthase/RimK-type ligase-like ATP-grasp enzyme
MSKLLQIYGYALRARGMFGKTREASRQAKSHRSKFYEDVWREAAGELGATFEELGGGVFKVSCNGASTRVLNNCTTLDDPVTLHVALDKPLVSKILRSHGLPTPDSVEFTLDSLNQAYEFLARYGVCVVKPADGTAGGDGVTTRIVTRRQLFKAAVRATGYGSTRLLAEEQAEGDTTRLLYLDGQLLDAVKRNPPSVLGDGKSSVSQLVRGLNQKRVDAGYQLAQATLQYDLEMKLTLARQKLSWRSVPAEGRRVVLKEVTNDNMADENESVAEQVSEGIIAAGRRAAEVIGARLVGIDIMTPDIRSGLEEAGGKILEVNTTPGLHLHYFTRGGACRVAVPILKTCLEHARK